MAGVEKLKKQLKVANPPIDIRWDNRFKTNLLILNCVSRMTMNFKSTYHYKS